ncbi:MAG: hypothetical protein JXQ93_14085 [Flavobacteriaceae bacterium]
METIKSAINIFKKHPIFILPLFMTWIVIATGVIYFKWHFPWSDYNTKGQLTFAYLFYFIASGTVLFSCSILVELIEQDENGIKMSISKAISDSLSKNIGHLFYLTLIWSITWFLLVLLKVLFSKKKNNGTEEESAENIARTLAGSDSFSWSTFTIDMLIQALRMIMFVIIPAFAWENKSFSNSFKRGIAIIGSRTSNFIDGFVISLGVQFIMYLPPSIMFYLSNKAKVEFDDIWWYICIVYIGFAWSFTLYVEQLFGAELYLWQMKYEKECNIAKKNNLPIPKFSDIEKPLLLDEIKDLKDIEEFKSKEVVESKKEKFKPKTRTEKMKENFKMKSNSELIYIIENRNKYQPIAIKLAENILTERNVG